jgi:hypothetical protein
VVAGAAAARLSRSDAGQFALIATLYRPGLVLLATAAVGVVALLATRIVPPAVEALFSSDRS